MGIEDTKILYLAQYAPCISSDNPLKYKENEGAAYKAYHNRIYNFLCSRFNSIHSSRNPQVLFENNNEFDYVFSLYNRMPFRNSEVFISSLCEYYKIPYLGARPNIRALAEDKHLSKMMAVYAGVKTPEWKIYNCKMKLEHPRFEPPYFCKPRFGAASEWIDESSVCQSWDSAKQKISTMLELGIDIILEQFIDGIYHTNPVLNNFENYLPLPCIEEKSDKMHGIVTHAQKRMLEKGLTRVASDDKAINSELNRLSLKMFKLVQPLDYSRFDYIVEKDTFTPYFIEFNVCCNLGEHSTVCQAAKSIGVSYDELLSNILFSSMWRQNLYDKGLRYKL